jgi:PH (Pleckstrin Homology) domain-containing protein
MDTSLSLAPQQEISRVLDSSESLIWSGIPRQGLLLRPNDALMIPFSLMWGGFAIFWEATVLRSNAPGFFALWGVPFVLIGVYLILGRFFVDAKIRANTFYGLTNRRAIIISGLFAKTTNSLPLRTLTDISLQERADGTGTILLGRPQPYSSWSSGMRWPGMSQYSTPGFELIPEAKRVHDQLLEAQRAA